MYSYRREIAALGEWLPIRPLGTINGGFVGVTSDCKSVPRLGRIMNAVGHVRRCIVAAFGYGGIPAGKHKETLEISINPGSERIDRSRPRRWAAAIATI